MLKALVRKQFLELKNFYFQGKKSRKKVSKLGIAGLIVLFIFVFLSMGLAFFGMGMLLSSTMLPAGLDWLYFAMMGLITVFVGVIGNVFYTYSALYNAHDNEFLLSMPIPPSKILFVRMLMIYISGFIFEAIVFIPTMLVYWVQTDLNAAKIIIPILLLFIIGLLITALCCIFGWIIALIASRLKNKAITTVLIAILLIGVYYFCYFKINTFLQSIAVNADKLSGIVKSYIYPFYSLGQACSGKFLHFLIFTLISFAVFFVTYYILSKSFVSIVTLKQGSKKAKYTAKTSKVRSIRQTLLIKELKHFSSSPVYMLNSGLGVVFLLGISVFMVIRADRLDDMIGILSMTIPNIDRFLPILATAVLGLIISIDAITAPSISLEGRNLWVLRSLPVNAWDVLLSKLGLHLMINCIPQIIAVITLGIVLCAPFTTILLMLAYSLLLTVLTAQIGLIADLKKPNFVWTNETVPIKQSISVLIVMLSGWVISLVLGGGCFAVRNIISPELYTLILSAVLAGISVSLHMWLKNKGCLVFDSLS